MNLPRALKNNGLSIVLLIIFLLLLGAQAYTGFVQHNKELVEMGKPNLAFIHYLGTGHFIESTFENWESEFLQMGMFVLLSAFLFQKGSAESNDPDAPSKETNIKPASNQKLPWPLKKGRFIRYVYSYSLSISFYILFLLSFCLHWYGSCKDYNLQQAQQGEHTVTMRAYLGNSRLWFESFQNWQSEFLAVFCMVTLSIFLRHRGSAQSKKLTDPDDKTG